MMVRNDIPIRDVIESFLKMPSKVAHGTFRFLCPVCSKYNTSINSPVNLARCFDCKKNFNPIDMVMTVRKADFVDTVKSLIKFKAVSSHDEKQPILRYHRLFDTRYQRSDRKTNGVPVAIGDVISQLLEKYCSDDQRFEKIPSPDDIAKLEQIVIALSHLINELKKHHHKSI